MGFSIWIYVFSRCNGFLINNQKNCLFNDLELRNSGGVIDFNPSGSKAPQYYVMGLFLVCNGIKKFLSDGFLTSVQWEKILASVKFIYSEKATKFCEIFPILLTTVHTVKCKGNILKKFVAFSEYMNFT